MSCRSDIIGSERGHFVLAINPPEEDFSTQSSLQLFPSTRGTLRVKLVLKEADLGLKEDKSVEQRNCRFPDEVEHGEQMFSM